MEKVKYRTKKINKTTFISNVLNNKKNKQVKVMQVIKITRKILTNRIK